MSTKISPETKQVLEWIKTELFAGMVLCPKNDGERVWNDAHMRVDRIIQNYVKGEGLFQMTAEPGPETDVKTEADQAAEAWCQIKDQEGRAHAIYCFRAGFIKARSPISGTRSPK